MCEPLMMQLINCERDLLYRLGTSNMTLFTFFGVSFDLILWDSYKFPPLASSITTQVFLICSEKNNSKCLIHLVNRFDYSIMWVKNFSSGGVILSRYTLTANSAYFESAKFLA